MMDAIGIRIQEVEQYENIAEIPEHRMTSAWPGYALSDASRAQAKLLGTKEAECLVAIRVMVVPNSNSQHSQKEYHDMVMGG